MFLQGGKIMSGMKKLEEFDEYGSSTLLIGFLWMAIVVGCLVLMNDGYILVPHYTDMSCIRVVDVD